MLVSKVDELVAMTSRDLDEIRAVTDQLEPDRARSCRHAITMASVARAGAGPVVPQRHHMASVMVDEIRLRAHARPLDEGEH
jgi:hypothetical protein